MLCITNNKNNMSLFQMISRHINSYFQPSNQNRKFQDRAQPLYSALNWNKSVIGGSYALHQFTGNLNTRHYWEPDDIDIMIGSDTEEEFQNEARLFEERCPELDLIKYSRKTDRGTRSNPASLGPNDFIEMVNVKTGEIKYQQLDLLDNPADIEIFHEYVRGSRTYEHPTAGKVQLVHIRPPPNRSLLSVLAETTDIPACVSYTVEKYEPLEGSLGLDAATTIIAMRNGLPTEYQNPMVETKVWHFPDKGREILLTGKGSVKNICHSRKKKYEERGYTFY